ncbi:MAG: hypothetical protein ACFCVK_11900 [Acidimicrobiales bacterium]
MIPRSDGRPTRDGERGDVMLTTIVLLTALLLASTILVSASEQWEARRKAAAAAATLARAAAQADPDLIRRGDDGIDPVTAQARVSAVTAELNDADPESTYEGRITAIEDRVVSTEVATSVAYTFPLPGFPSRIVGSAQAEAVRGGID